MSDSIFWSAVAYNSTARFWGLLWSGILVVPGAFTVSVLKALSLYNSQYVTNKELAEKACHIEIDRLGEPVGKQDQYASAIGGINEFIFHKDDTVEFNKLPISESNLENFQDSILLFFTGYSRSASKILSEQDNLSKKSDP